MEFNTTHLLLEATQKNNPIPWHRCTAQQKPWLRFLTYRLDIIINYTPPKKKLATKNDSKICKKVQQ